MSVPTEETNREIQIQNPKDVSIHEFESTERRGNKKNKEKRFQKSLHKDMEKRRLKQLLQKNKMESMKNNFVYKLRMNSENRTPPDDFDQNEAIDEQKGRYQQCLQKLKKTNGLNAGNIGLTIWISISIFHSVLMVFLFSIMLAFPQTLKDEIFWYFRVYSFGIYLLDIILNCFVVRYEEGNLLQNIYDISSFYIEKYLIVDLGSSLIFMVNILLPFNTSFVGLFVAIVRFICSKRKLQKLEYLYITSTEREQYYGLIKVLLTNFAIGHFLSILLNLMAGISPANNWYMKVNISSSSWFVKYIWGYYWGANIMLTVGFGDLSATNQYEALLLVFIETFSCITLAFNISCVGSLMSIIQEDESQMKKKLRFFHRMCQENQIPKELEEKISNHIAESHEIKEGFCYDEYDEVIQTLPEDMQIEYKKEANKVIFDHSSFFNSLSRKTLLKMAELVERKISHPKEVLLKKGEKAELMILQKGSLLLTCKINSKKSQLDGRVIQKISVDKDDKPTIINLDFIKNKTLSYDILSSDYSILYKLSEEKIKQALKYSKMDYELFCLVKDKEQGIFDQLNIQPCSVCKNKNHNKFQCPKLHFVPLRQMVIFRELKKIKINKSQRIRFLRKHNCHQTLRFAKDLPKQYEKVDNSYLSSCVMSTPFLSSIGSSDSPLMEFSNRKKKGDRRRPRRSRGQGTRIIGKLQQMINQNLMEKKFWDLESDEAHNYSFYFKTGNPSNLIWKFGRKKKNY